MLLEKDSYIPPLKYHFLTKYYDFVVRLTTRESVFKRELVKQCVTDAKQRILDIGCGTGNLTKMLALGNSQANIVAFDADKTALDIAQKNNRELASRIQYQLGMAQALPFESDTFDVVVSSLFFHHLTLAQKQLVLLQCKNVLKQNGTIYIADWGTPTSRLQRFLFYIVQLLDGFETTSDNVTGLLPKLLEEAGFNQVSNIFTCQTMLGTIRILSASK